MKPFDHRKAETPVFEILKPSTLSGLLRPLNSQLTLDLANPEALGLEDSLKTFDIETFETVTSWGTL